MNKSTNKKSVTPSEDVELTDAKRIRSIRATANNALYFGDESDYRSALWAILEMADIALYRKYQDGRAIRYIEEPE